MSVDSRMRVLIVGFGAIAQRYALDRVMARWFPFATHAQVLQAHPEFELTAVVDRDEQARGEAREKWGIKETVAHLEDLRDADQYDILVLATPPEVYLECLDVAPNIKAVVVEKPLGLSVDIARDFLNRCESTNILVQVNFPRRADRVMRSLVKALPENLGEIQMATALYGNGLINNGSHVIDWARMFLGEVSWVSTFSEAPIVHESPFADDFNIPFVAGFENKSYLTASPLKFSHFRENSLDIWGSRGRLSFYQEGLMAKSYSLSEHRFSSDSREIPSDRPDVFLTDQGRAMYELYDNLYRCLTRNELLCSPGISALRVMEIIEAIRYSHSKGGVSVKV